MNRRIGYTAGLVALAGLAACGRQSAPVSDDLQRDLDMASTSGVELAPKSPRTDVVSALELGTGAPAPKAEAPQPSPEHRTPARAPRSQVARHTPAPHVATPQVAVAPERQAPEPSPVAETPSPVVDAPAPARRQTAESQPDAIYVPSSAPTGSPLPMPSRSRGRRSGTATMGDVIRNAPFPILP